MEQIEARASGGVALALISAASFALSGSFASSLFDAGWSPGAAVTARIAIAALVLSVPAIRSMRNRWYLVRPNIHLILLFGLLAVAGAQLFYFNAVQTLSVGVALMLEYVGLILVVGWQWVTSRQSPRLSTLLGVALAVVGLVLVLDAFGGVSVDLVGVFWGLSAAVGLATYFVIAGDDRSELPPLAMAAGGMIVGALTLGIVGALGLLPMRASTADVSLVGVELPWFGSVIGLGLIAGAIAYSTGVASTRILGSKVSAFLGLSEVMFAVLFAWVLLGELPKLVQLGGGLLILIGIAVVRREQVALDAIGVEPIPDAETVTYDPFDTADRRHD